MNVFISVIVAMLFYLWSINVFNLGPIGAAVPTFIVYIAIYILLRTITKRSVPIEVEQLSKVYYEEIVQEGIQINDRIKRLIPHITHQKTKEQAVKTMGESERIVSILQDEPQEVKIVRQFFSYYLLTFEKVIAKSIEINGQANRNEKLESLNERVYENLLALEQLFKQKINSLLEDDVMELDNELLLLEKMMKSEGVNKI